MCGNERVLSATKRPTAVMLLPLPLLRPASCASATATPARCACVPTKAHRPWCALLVPRRPVNGGMFELGALQAAVMRRRGSRSDPVSEDDIVRAIKKLKVGRAHAFSRASSSSQRRPHAFYHLSAT